MKMIQFKIELFLQNKISKRKMHEIFQGWNAYSKWANTYKLRRRIYNEISVILKNINYPEDHY